jgi:hypothetical protein
LTGTQSFLAYGVEQPTFERRKIQIHALPERLLHFVDKLMLDLIEDMGGSVVRSGLWT